MILPRKIEMVLSPSQPMNQRSTVALTACPDYQSENIAAALQRQFGLLGGMEKFISKGDQVLIKPNFIAPRPARQAVQTDPAIIIELARLIKDFGARPFVGDSPAWADTFACVKALGLDEPLKRLSVPIRQLNKPRRHSINGSRVGISALALDADKIINLPKFKTHQQLYATFAVKNIFGCVSGKEKALWHFIKGSSSSDFCSMLIGIYKLLSPSLTLIDAVTVMEGPGPINGIARPLGLLIGGVDPIACELVCCELVGFNPDDLPMIRTARRQHFGSDNINSVRIAGDDYKNFICPDFQAARQVPLRFSFIQVCKSIAKQIKMITRSVLNPERFEKA